MLSSFVLQMKTVNNIVSSYDELVKTGRSLQWVKKATRLKIVSKINFPLIKILPPEKA